MKMEDLPGRVYVDGNTASPFIQEKKQRQVAKRTAPAKKRVRKKKARNDNGQYQKESI